MLLGEGLHSLYNYTVRCFLVSSAVLQRCHSRGWTTLFPLYLFSRQLTMEHSAGGNPDPLIMLWPPWPSQLENRKQQTTACLPAPTTTPRLFQTTPPICLQYTPSQHPIITLVYTDALPVTKDICLHNNVITAM